MPKLRVHNFSISMDGYAAGPEQGVDDQRGALDRSHRHGLDTAAPAHCMNPCVAT